MILYGKQIFLYMLDKYPHLIEEIYLSKEIDKKLFSRLQQLNKPIVKPDTKKAQALARGGNHQGFLVKVKPYEYTPFSTIKNGEFILVLAGVTDVGNIGAMVRTAYALGVSGVVISMLNQVNMEAIVRSSSGAALDMPITIQKDIGTVLNELKQNSFHIYGADMSGVDVREESFSGKKVLVLGSEGAGLSNKVLNMCSKKIKIKMQREFDSLNVSVACALLCDRMR